MEYPSVMKLNSESHYYKLIYRTNIIYYGFIYYIDIDKLNWRDKSCGIIDERDANIDNNCP